MSYIKGFKKNIKGWLQQLGEFVGGNTHRIDTATQPVQPESKPVSYFHSKSIDPTFRKLLNNAIKLNQSEQDVRVKIKYKKKGNGRTVVREVTPYTASQPKNSKHNNLLVGFDHKRNEIRSYLTDGILNVKKI